MPVDFLPAELLLNILEFLDYKSVIICCGVNKHWRSISSSNAAWKEICGKYSIQPSAKETFLEKMVEYGNHFQLYCIMNGLCDRLQRWTQEHATVNMKPKAPIEIVKATDPCSSIGQLFMFYHLFGGGQNRDDSPLFGHAQVYEKQYSMFLQPYQLVQEQIHSDTIQFAGRDSPLNPSNFIIYLNEIFLMDQEMNLYKRGNDFLDYISNYVSDLEKGRYDVENGKIQMFPNFGPNTATGTTKNGLTVSISSIPLTRFDMVHAYRIKIEFDPDIAIHNPCQLLSRCFKFVEIGNTVQIIDAPGVVGLHPTFSSQTTEFSYASQAQYLKTMSGKFVFKNQLGQPFDVPVPLIEFEESCDEWNNGREQ
jgi:uncharacterized protein affecting Mg2+/Co2+ transport